jgi:hypothetical protein
MIRHEESLYRLPDEHSLQVISMLALMSEFFGFNQKPLPCLRILQATYIGVAMLDTNQTTSRHQQLKERVAIDEKRV